MKFKVLINLIILVPMLLLAAYINKAFIDIKQHTIEMQLTSDHTLFAAHITALQRELMMILIFSGLTVIGLLTVWAISYRKAITADQLRRRKEALQSFNSQLMTQQNSLEEQMAIVEELNAQLEDESIKKQQQRDTLQAIIDSVERGIVMTNQAGEVIVMNKVWREEFYQIPAGDEVAAAREQNPEADTVFAYLVTGAVNPEPILTELKALVYDSEKNYRSELEQTKPLHRYVRVISVPCKASNGQALGRIFLCRDISRYKEVDRLKADLISTVSHELRTPMSSVMGFSELLLTRQLSPERSKQYLEIIHTQAERLTNLINDFLDIQRMESGKQAFNKQPIKFGEIIAGTLDLFKENNKKHRVVLKNALTELPVVRCDRDKLLQVMSNLLSNAIKYSPEGGDVMIETLVENDELKVSVTDHGLGVPEHVQNKLFTKFYRVDNDDRREIGGTGLGLAICKEIIKAHGGEIGVISTYGQGSTFYFTLPIAADDFAHKSSGNTTAKSSDENTILVVEDDEGLVELVKDILLQEGFVTHAVNNGRDALKLAEETSYKIIILDIGLVGDLNGWDVLKALRSKSKTAGIPVIISSVYEERDPKSDEFRDYLVKPFTPQQLVKVVQKVVEEDMEAKMMLHSDKNIEQSIVNILRKEGISVKDFRRSEDILMITLGSDTDNVTT